MRICVATLLASALWMPCAQAAKKASASGEYFVYIGTYTRESSKGIYAYRFHPADGKLTPIGLVAETTNPSFLAIHPNGRSLYAVNEVDTLNGEKAGGVSAFRIDPRNGKLIFLNTVSSKGAGPCHLLVDKTGKNLLVANYGSGSVASLPDQALVYRFNAAKGSLTPNDPPFAKLNPGAGPRHFAFDPKEKHAYVINEIQSTVTAFSYDRGRGAFQELQTVSTLPKDFSGQNSTAEIAVDRKGKFLYGSNRGHNSIAVFAIDPGKGTLTPVEQTPTEGKVPRNFAIDPTGAYLFAANQNSGDVVLFRIDSNTGRLTPTGEKMEVSSPVCVVFVPAR